MVIFLLTISLLISVFLPLMLLTIFLLVSLKSKKDNEKLSPYECGFTPLESSWQSFSIQFFLVALIFLVFDIELVLMYPLIAAYSKATITEALRVFLLFFLVLLIGFIIEWSSSQLDWFI